MTKDENGIIEGTVTSATFNGTGAGDDCTSGSGDFKFVVNSGLCLSIAKGVDTVIIKGCTGAIKFTLFFTSSGLDCEYESAEVKGTFTTNVSPAPTVVSEQPAKKIAGGILCPSESKLDMTFDFYTDNLPTETPLTLS